MKLYISGIIIEEVIPGPWFNWTRFILFLLKPGLVYDNELSVKISKIKVCIDKLSSHWLPEMKLHLHSRQW